MSRERVDALMAGFVQDVRRDTEWVAADDAGPKVGVNPARTVVEQRLEVAKAKARGAAEVIAVIEGRTADEVVAEYVRRFWE